MAVPTMGAFPTMGVPDTGDTAWMLASAALVMLMTPGLAFFYGGMVRAKGVLNMMMMSMSAMAVVGLLWVLYGYSVAFGEDEANLIGNPVQYFGLAGLLGGDSKAGTHIALVGSVPATVFVAFQLMFAIITVALISGAVADRMRIGAWMVFAGLWATIVYFPVAHWVFALDGQGGAVGGWIVNKLKAVDFAGGTAVEINAGVAGLVLAVIVGKRHGWPKEPMRPHNLPFVMLGSGLLWFGWYGFNAGSAYSANGAAGTTFITTTVAACAGMLAWLAVERRRDGHATSLGGASGVVAGLVAITPSCSAVNVLGALLIGVLAGALCALAVGLKHRFGYDDSLDLVGVHLVGGIVGTLMIGLVAAPESPAGVAGSFYGGGVDQLWRQAVAVVVVLVYSLVCTTAIALVLKVTVGLRIDHEGELRGVDETEHAESAYDFAPSHGGGTRRDHVFSSATMGQ